MARNVYLFTDNSSLGKTHTHGEVTDISVTDPFPGVVGFIKVI